MQCTSTAQIPNPHSRIAFLASHLSNLLSSQFSAEIMPVYCSGCSQRFEAIRGPEGRCGRCNARGPSANGKENWPNCLSCGELYEHLCSKICGQCDYERQRSGDVSAHRAGGSGLNIVSTLVLSILTNVTATLDMAIAPAAIQHAIENSVDPRSHNKPGTIPYTNPYIPDPSALTFNRLTRGENNREDELRQSANRLKDALSGSYLNALSNAEPGIRLGRSNLKIKSAASDAKSSNDAIARFNVILRNIINGNKKGLKIPVFTPPLLQYTGSTQWGSVLEDIRIILSGLYSKLYNGYKIRSTSQFQLAFANGTKTQVPVYEPDTVFSQIWQECIRKKNLVTTVNDVKLFKLELTAVVDYPPLEDPEDDIPSGSTRSKRSRTLSMVSQIDTDHAPKRRAATAGSGAYLTRLEDAVSEMSYAVIKVTCRLPSQAGGQVRWSRTATFSIDIEEESFASGATKHAYKLQIRDDSQVYAAKKFYNIGRRPESVTGTGVAIPYDVNTKHLKEELILACIAKRSLERFNGLLLQRSVHSAFDLVINEPFIITVAEGSDKGMSWLVDTYLGDEPVTKFSGTQCAGSNSDSAGMTCDAFAHFSLHDSDGSFVLVDIQGIITSRRLAGANIAGESKAMLFDFMAHSSGPEMMCLGDKGKTGIKQFCQQHVCNDICKALGLEELSADSYSSELSDNGAHGYIDDLEDNPDPGALRSKTPDGLSYSDGPFTGTGNSSKMAPPPPPVPVMAPTDTAAEEEPFKGGCS
ncbi:hypothetical protein CVT24_005570 [Panaeolus cyanescens]|uniref:Alpha-type protein kinase domain-containing protein n=1 Tax=Panaeolus cyanescens TaxID=181874 RepID=A0A409YY90_9AGAR|nr:hypothetical protein CVT24_005570 [Panaeolus cyanescens]